MKNNINNILLIVKKTLNNSKELSKLKKLLNSKAIEFELINKYDKIPNKQFDLAIVLGGDGLLLWSAKQFINSNTFLFGINFGHLGFLTDIEKDKMFSMIDKILMGNYQIINRSILEISLKQKKYYALNECVLLRSDNKVSITLDLSIDGYNFDKFPSDGIIISTPTGSTAHIFNCGGTLMYPDVPALELMPLAARTIIPSPLIVSEKSKIDAKIDRDSKSSGELVLDGDEKVEMEIGETVVFTTYKRPIKFVSVSNIDFSNRLITKLN